MSDMKKVTLVLSDGTKFHGKSFGYDAPVAGEVVFNTAMMGYPESLTDPSYAGQLMTLTFPLVGNYGVPPFTFEENGLPTFMESDKIYASAIIVNDYSEQYSHWNAVESLADWLKREKVPGITGIDTRELTKVLREHGVMMGKILFDDEPDNIPEANYEGVNFVDQVSCKEIIRYNEGAGKKVVLVDCGVKANIIRCLINRGVEVIRVPWNYDYTDMDFDGLFLANGPGDPDMCDYEAEIHGVAGGWPHYFYKENKAQGAAWKETKLTELEKARLEGARYYDGVNFARRITVPGWYSFGYNDEVVPPTSSYGLYNSVKAPKTLSLYQMTGHYWYQEQWDEWQAWIIQQLTK